MLDCSELFLSAIDWVLSMLNVSFFFGLVDFSARCILYCVIMLQSIFQFAISNFYRICLRLASDFSKFSMANYYR